jgi:hypothetical protein
VLKRVFNLIRNENIKTLYSINQTKCLIYNAFKLRNNNEQNVSIYLGKIPSEALFINM